MIGGQSGQLPTGLIAHPGFGSYLLVLQLLFTPLTLFNWQNLRKYIPKTNNSSLKLPMCHGQDVHCTCGEGNRGHKDTFLSIALRMRGKT